MANGIKMILHPHYLPRKTSPGFFSLSESEVSSGRPLTVPRQLQDKLSWAGVMSTIAKDDGFATTFW
jgi:hypothetical protein